MKLEALFEKIYTPVAELSGVVYKTAEPLPFDRKTEGQAMPVREGVKWAENRFDCGWFCLEGDAPNADGRHLVLMLDLGGEACAYTADGVPLKGFTNVKSEFTIALGKPAKQILWDISPFVTDGRLKIWLDAAANDLFGNFIDGGMVKTLRLAVCDDALRKLYYDTEVMTKADKLFADAAEALSENDIEGLKALTSQYFSRYGDGDKTVFAEGHAHIDLAWLWPVRETRRKALRTFSTVLYNSRLYGDYIFGASQPQLLQWLKEDSPETFGGLKSLYDSKRFEVQGMFWVECDANLTSGEALIRQAIYGNAFWKNEFGCTSDMCWLPDTFGFNGQLPQIIKGCDGKYFLTTKLSWNETNAFPYNSFIWKGIDGSEVLAHIPPEGNYNSAASPTSLKQIAEKTANDNCTVAMMLYGIGDGGGGPGMEHLERLQREAALPSLPKVQNATAGDFFAALEQHKAALPVWKGELYLEKHQGTYTTHANIKQHNAHCERRLTLLECLSAPDVLTNGFALKNCLDELWKQVLFLQFHDILPGSAIGRVYDEAKAQYADIEKQLDELMPNGNSLFNPTSFARKEYALKDSKAICLNALPFGSADVAECEDKGVLGDKCCMENDLIKVSFNYDGSILSIFDKQTGCELLRDNAAYFCLYPDDENAWEVAHHRQADAKKFELESVDCEEGIIAIMHHTYKLGESTLKCDISLAKDSKRLDFDLELELKEEKCCLRCDFPLNISADTARCGIPFGSIERPTHSRDSIAAAMKEVCCRYFVDISDGEEGAALLSADKYGYDIKGNTLSINLLRNSTCPRDTVSTDTGHHKIRFAFYAHSGDWQSGRVVREAYLFANPILPELPYVQSIASTDRENIVIEAIKPGEDGHSVVIRLYECHGLPTNCCITLNPDLDGHELYLADMQENIIAKTSKTLSFSPFEIKTLLIKR